MTVPIHKKGVTSVDSQVDNRTDLYRTNMANRDPKDEGDMGVPPVSAPDVNSKLDIIVCPGTLKVVPCQTDEAMVHETKGDPSCVWLPQNEISLGTHRKPGLRLIQYSSLDRHCRICRNSGGRTQMDGYICFDCGCLMTLCCCVSCLVTVATARLIKMDQFVYDRNPFAWNMNLLCNHMTPV